MAVTRQKTQQQHRNTLTSLCVAVALVAATSIIQGCGDDTLNMNPDGMIKYFCTLKTTNYVEALKSKATKSLMAACQKATGGTKVTRGESELSCEENGLLNLTATSEEVTDDIIENCTESISRTLNTSNPFHLVKKISKAAHEYFVSHRGKLDGYKERFSNAVDAAQSALADDDTEDETAPVDTEAKYSTAMIISLISAHSTAALATLGVGLSALAIGLAAGALVLLRISRSRRDGASGPCVAECPHEETVAGEALLKELSTLDRLHATVSKSDLSSSGFV